MKLLQGIIILLFGMLIGMFVITIDIEPKIDLPEEYKEIIYDTAIIGYFDKDSVLHIEFDKRIQFEWEGLEQDIPKYNTFIQMTRLYDKVYLNPIDE